MSAGTDWSIHEIARLAGTTKRTLRHYDAVGLVAPSRIGDNGYRYYDADERLAKNYGGLAGATFVRDAMAVYSDRNL